MKDLCTLAVVGSAAAHGFQGVRRDLLQPCHYILGQRLGNDAFVLDQVGHGIGIDRFTPGMAFRHAGRRRGHDDRLLVLGQAIPHLLVDQQLGDVGGLTPAGGVVVLGRLVQAQTAVLIGADQTRRRR